MIDFMRLKANSICHRDRYNSRTCFRLHPDCSVVWVPTGGHLLVWEEPELVATSVARAARDAGRQTMRDWRSPQ